MSYITVLKEALIMENRMKNLQMEFDVERSTEDVNSYKIVDAEKIVNDFNNFIEIIDENGTNVTLTNDKFVEIFDNEGLSGFIL